MKHFFGLLTLVFVGMVAWRIGDNLSSDAIGMAIGVLFGVLAGIPTALLVMAGGRRREVERDEMPSGHGLQRRAQDMPYAMHPPVIVLAGQGSMPPAGQMSGGQPWGNYNGQQDGVWPVGPGAQQGWPVQRQERQFKVVGETEEWIDEF